ncbi:39s ribosomal protein l47 [Quercus suber]|uniref:Large ribosomal subunit protein uL29m n=2 Tax=Quercus suber TaxID=58331 RepID=A0AAW0M860_QUESU
MAILQSTNIPKTVFSEQTQAGSYHRAFIILFISADLLASGSSIALSLGDNNNAIVKNFGRTLFAAAKSETSNATAAAASVARNPLQEFFEADRNIDDDKPVVYGRSWKASELRLKSWDDLNKLWYVLLKEKNMLMTQRQMLHSQNLRFPNPERIPKV